LNEQRAVMADRQKMRKDQYYWNVVALVAFLIFCGISAAVLSRYAAVDLGEFGFLDLALLGLGTFRLVHLITYDKIFAIVRDPFMDSKGGRLRKASRGWRRLMCEFIECIWCTGMWSAVLVVTVYLLDSWGKFAVIVLAVAGLGSLLQVVSKAIARTNE
jgi:hypothetical protein